MSARDENLPTSSDAAYRLLQTLSVESQARQTLASLARLVAWAAEAPMAAVLATLPDRIETLAAHGIAPGGVAAAWDYRAAGYSPRELFAIGDARAHLYLAKRRFVRQSPKLRAILRFPVRSEHLPFVVALGVADTAPREEATWPSQRLRETLYEMAAIAEAEIAIAAEVVGAGEEKPDADPTLQEIVMTLTRSAEPGLLVDDALRLVRANAAMSALLGVPREATDRVLSDFAVPGAQTLARLARRSLEVGKGIADIAFDLRHDENDPVVRSASISVDPLAARDRPGKYLLIRARDVSQPLSGILGLEALIAPPLAPPDLAEIDRTFDFLCETLVPRAVVRHWRATSYITLRSWRGVLKAYQVKALRALKQAPPAALVETIAAEMQEAFELMIGRAAVGGVVPVPCGYSAPEHCLSARVAESLAGRLGLPRIAALASEGRSSASPLVDNTRRPSIRLAQNPGCPVLLVDDVAASGRPLAEAAALLRPGCSAVFPLAWIGGDGAE